MTDPASTPPPPDPSASWANSASFTPQPYSPAMPAAALRAPEGTDPYTTWIWLILAIPVVQLLPVFFIDWSGFVEASVSDPTGLGVYGLIFTPAYVALIVFGWVGSALMIWFAYLDWRELQQRGVPQPFHWAWIFLTFVISYAVYTIGRSVVVKRRTGRGMAPMWITIATIIFSLAVGIGVTVVIFQLVFDSVMTMSFAP